jgi:hypothetical protein
LNVGFIFSIETRSLIEVGLYKGDCSDSEASALERRLGHRPKIHSINPVERLNGEIKRRTDVVDSFPNEGAITRLIGALLLEQNDEWAVQRGRYMSLGTIVPLSDEFPSSSCPPWQQLDRPGPARDHDGLAVVTPLTGTGSRPLGTSCRESEADAAFGLDDASCDFQKPEPKGP